MPNIGTFELIIIFLVVLVLFGPKAIPRLAQAIGSGIRELKDAMSGVSREIERENAPPRVETSVPRESSETTQPSNQDKA